MSTWSVRCRHFPCRMRRVTRVHPDLDDSKCPSCGSVKGWRHEARTYNKTGRCYCSGPLGRDGMQYPHHPTHPCCDQHPLGHVNQALQRGLTRADLPVEHMGVAMAADADCPF